MRSQIAVFIEKVDFQDLKAIIIVSKTNERCNNEGEEITESSEADTGCYGVVVVTIEKLYKYW